MPHRLGIIPHAYAQPLFAGLRGPEGAPASAFELVTESSAQLALELRQGRLDGAFLSPVEYARDYSHLSIVPESAAVSRGESGTVLLLFRERGTQVKTVAVDPSSSSEIVLLHLVMAEKYDVVPQFLPVNAPPEAALKSADAVLVVGNTAAAMRGWERKLDIVDEWDDATGLPFIHGFWAVRTGALGPAPVETLRATGPQADARRRDDPPDNFWYTLSPGDHAALAEFLRMAYYHGILKDIPDLKFLQRSPAASSTAMN